MKNTSPFAVQLYIIPNSYLLPPIYIVYMGPNISMLITPRVPTATLVADFALESFYLETDHGWHMTDRKL